MPTRLPLSRAPVLHCTGRSPPPLSQLETPGQGAFPPSFFSLCRGFPNNPPLSFANNAPRRYIAPEVLQRKEYKGETADVWSLGVTLYVMLVGAYPFEDPADPRNFRKTIQRIMAVQYSIPTQLKISDSCKDMLQRIFVADPSEEGAPSPFPAPAPDPPSPFPDPLLQHTASPSRRSCRRPGSSRTCPRSWPTSTPTGREGATRRTGAGSGQDLWLPMVLPSPSDLP